MYIICRLLLSWITYKYLLGACIYMYVLHVGLLWWLWLPRVTYSSSSPEWDGRSVRRGHGVNCGQSSVAAGGRESVALTPCPLQTRQQGQLWENSPPHNRQATHHLAQYYALKGLLHGVSLTHSLSVCVNDLHVCVYTCICASMHVSVILVCVYMCMIHMGAYIQSCMYNVHVYRSGGPTMTRCTATKMR